VSTHQNAILAPLPPLGRYLFFQLSSPDDALDALDALGSLAADDDRVVGIGSSLALSHSEHDFGLRPFPSLSGPGIEVPSTQTAAWCWLRGHEDRGKLIHRTLELLPAFDPLDLTHVIDSFKHDPTPAGLGRDLTGYEDGTENPHGDEATNAAIVSGAGPGLDGASFVAVQQWQHDLVEFDAFTEPERDHIIGRRRSDNEELDDAPSYAHVKRTAQESFRPEAFVVRQSMPWSDAGQEGLVFVAFGRTLDAFEAQLTRMVGLDDGVVDGLFRFSHPVSGAYFWCPPVKDGRLDLSAVSR